jgi:hypothetical protein
VKQRPKQELAVWITGCVLAMVLLLLSHTFYVTSSTYAFGFVLIALAGFLSWLRFSRQELSRPRWLLISANAVLAVIAFIVLLYVLGVATWYE